MHGLGVVLGRQPLVGDDIESGRLVPLTGQPIPSGCGYFLVAAQTDFQKPEVTLFRRWLLSGLGIADERQEPSRSHAHASA
jgi:LysR family glycine cleavage system transcriptional activator